MNDDRGRGTERYRERELHGPPAPAHGALDRALERSRSLLLALARIAPWRRAWSAHEQVWALMVLWLATAPLVMTWAFVWSR